MTCGGVFVAERSNWLALSQLILDFKHSAVAAAEVLAVRDSLETLIASEAATHHRKRDITQLRRLIEDMTQHAQDPAGYLRTNWAFHRRAAQLDPDVCRAVEVAAALDVREVGLGEVQQPLVERPGEGGRRS
jgi:FCD domain